MTDKLIAQAEAVASRLGQLSSPSAERMDDGGRLTSFIRCGQEAADVIPALIARIRELEGERDDYARAWGEACADAMKADDGKEAAEATVATLTAQMEAMQRERDKAVTFLREAVHDLKVEERSDTSERGKECVAFLAAAVPDELAEAGKVLEQLAPYGGNGRGKNHPQSVACRNAADTITALLARIAAQEAQMKVLEAKVAEVTSDRAYIIGANAGWEAAVEQGEATPAAAAMLAQLEAAEKRPSWDEYNALLSAGYEQKARAEAAETALATVTKERDELRASIAWVDEVYPERIEAGGAGIQITWGEFNAMQAAIGVTVDKRIGGPEGKAVHNQRLRSALAAERAKVERLREAGKRVLAPLDEPCRHDHHCYCQAHFIEADCSVAALRAAITEAGQ